MMAKAIGPQNTVGAIGMKPSTVEIAVSMIGRKRDTGAFDNRVPEVAALRALGLDLLDEDDRVARDHAHQGQNAENGDKAERPSGAISSADDADEAHRHEAEHHGERG